MLCPVTRLGGVTGALHPMPAGLQGGRTQDTATEQPALPRALQCHGSGGHSLLLGGPKVRVRPRPVGHGKLPPPQGRPPCTLHWSLACSDGKEENGEVGLGGGSSAGEGRGRGPRRAAWAGALPHLHCQVCAQGCSPGEAPAGTGHSAHPHGLTARARG